MSEIFEKIKIPKLDLNGSKALGSEIRTEIEKITKDIRDRQDNAMAMEFKKCIGELLKKNGVAPKITEVRTGGTFDKERNVIEERYGVAIEGLDFSEHDKVFEDKIADLESLMQKQDEFLEMKNIQIVELKQRIAELESKEVEKPTKINLNDLIKVKLTPLGAEIYYHQYDEVNKKIKENGGTELKPMMPQIDKDRFTEFQLWHFIELYGEHIGVCKPNVINPLEIIISE